ncbi:hypothetical protein BGW42_007931 [Actinomortierella wolfii]|nr:hypothetical protein BGW42_007931 [Actinomortierella wolfii]
MASHHMPRTRNERNFPDTTAEDYDPVVAAAESQRKQSATPSMPSGSQRTSKGSDAYSDRYNVSFLDTNDPSIRYIGSSGSSTASTVVTSFSDDDHPNEIRPQLGLSPEMGLTNQARGLVQPINATLPGLQGQSLDARTQALNRTMLLSGSR